MTKTIDLSGQWQLSDSEGEYQLGIHLPTDVVSCLYEHDKIPDPYWGRNEYDLRWIAEREWTVTREFDLSDDNVELVLSGLDTVCSIAINGQLVQSTDNAFRRYVMPLKGFAKPGLNRIAITFHSAVKEGKQRQNAQPFTVPQLDSNVGHPIKNINMLRKTQCDFGWDWNVALAPLGLYGESKIRSTEKTFIENILVKQQHDLKNDSASVSITVETNGIPLNEPAVVELCGQQKDIHLTTGATTVELRLENPELWWPTGHGSQTLHELKVTLGDETISKKIGLRSAYLSLIPDDAGTGFSVQINGRPIFAKGANWIPADALAGRITPEKTRELLQSAVDANMNMIRVWGGGRYEADWFYDLCDELGLMVWQDFMFACHLYPSDETFLANVTQEVTENVKRLQYHASIVLWCGDNELVGALTWYEESVKNRDRYLVAYDRLNHTIEQALKQADDSAIWWPSSPAPGYMDYGDSWHDDGSGDMHFWSVWHEGKDFEHYREIKPRFCSEFGFQSYPSMPIVRTFANEEDFNIGAPVFESHQKNDAGNARIAETMFRYFRFPNNFENFVYLSQIQQGMAIKTAVSYWRSLKPHCMGMLYWQLNDTWPVASWSSLNYGGSWKLLHYMARQFYAPVYVSAVPQDDLILFKAVNDSATAVVVTLEVYALSTEGSLRHLSSVEKRTDVHSATDIASINVAALKENEVVLYRWQDETGKQLEDHFSPTPYKALELKDANIRMEIEDAGATVTISLKSDHTAFYVSLEATCEGTFSDNAFILCPESPRTITFSKRKMEDKPEFELRDLYSATYA